jgi:hypothetical protein
LPAKIANAELDFDIARLSGATYANLALAASYGLTDDLTIRATLLPLQLAGPGPSAFRYGQVSDSANVGPLVGVSYALRRDRVEVALSLDAGFSTIPNSAGLLFTPGVPVRIHAGKGIRVDTGVYLPFSRLASTSTVATSPSTTPAEATSNVFTDTLGLTIPASILYDITEPLHVGVGTAFQVGDVSEWSSTAAVPLSLFTGYAIAGKEGPLLDIDPFLTFPALLTPGAPKTTDAKDFMVGLSLGGFLYL